MTRPLPVIAELEQALAAHASALAGGDPAQLERCNAAVADVLGRLRREARAGAGSAGLPGPRALARLRDRLAAHGALVARAGQANRQALAVMGLAATDAPAPGQAASSSPHGAEPPARRATHLLA